MTLTQALQDAIARSGLSVNKIAKAANVPQSALSHFLSKEPIQHRDIRLATADKLAEFFGLELAPRPVKKTTATAAKRKAPKAKAGSVKNSSKKPGRVQKITPEEMDVEIERVQRKKSRLRVVRHEDE